MGYCPCCARATHIAVHPTSTLGDYGSIKELGMSLWAADGPWAAIGLAAASRVTDSNGAPLLTPGYWAARSLEFTAQQGASAPIPTVAYAGKNNKRPMMDLDKQSTPDEP